MGRVKAYILDYPARAMAWGLCFTIGLGQFLAWLLTGSLANDFSVYHRAANQAVFWAYWHSHESPFPYMPTMLLWITPLKLLPLWPAFILWVAASIFALVKACRPYLSRPELWLLAACPPLTNGLMTGQVAIAMAALTVLACGMKNRYAAGVAFGVIASIKPQLAVMVPLLLLLRSDWPAIASAALTFVVLVGLSVLAYGTETWLAWANSLAEFSFRLRIMGIWSISPAGAAARFGIYPLPFHLAGIAAGAWLVWRCRNLGPVETAAAIGAGSILATPYALTYDLAVVAPFLVLAVFKNRVLAAAALSGVTPPWPILMSAFELVVRAKRYGTDEVATEPARTTTLLERA